MVLGWLRRFFYSDDPIVRVRAALLEPEAESFRVLLENNNVPAMIKNVGSGADYRLGRATLFSPDYDLFVRRSDLERAEEVLPPDDRGQADEG